jgi:ParB family chromosome partitioning protein
MTSPTVKRFSQVFDDVTSQAVRDIDTAEITASAISDRFDINDDLETLIESIRANGQKIAVLLRPLPSPRDGALYEPIYGRRRIAAAQALGIPVKAHIVEMDDTEALIAQGIENAARKDTSFIERVVFVRDLLNAGLDTDAVSDALSIDKTTIARMNAISKALPDELMRAIGPAPDSGRRPWTDLRVHYTAHSASVLPALLEAISRLEGSDQRLMAAISFLSQAPSPALGLAKTPVKTIGAFRMTTTDKALQIKAGPKADPAFLAWLAGRLEDIHEEWQSSKLEVNNAKH